MRKGYFQKLLRNPAKVIDEQVTKIINNQLDIKFGQFTEEELNVVLTKNSKQKSCESRPKARPHYEIWKTRKYEYFLHRFCNYVYKQNTNEKWPRFLMGLNEKILSLTWLHEPCPAHLYLGWGKIRYPFWHWPSR